MNYKEYTARIEFDDTIEVFHGRILGIRDVITFEGKSVPALKKAFHEAVDDYLEWCAESGRPPHKPLSGNFRLRLDPELHRQAAIAAERGGESLNSFVTRCIRNTVSGGE